jgi:hypothetical protein
MRITVNELKKIIFEEVQRASRGQNMTIREAPRGHYNPQAQRGGYFDSRLGQYLPTDADMGEYDDVEDLDSPEDDEYLGDGEELDPGGYWDEEPDLDPIPAEDDARFARLDKLRF